MPPSDHLLRYTTRRTAHDPHTPAWSTHGLRTEIYRHEAKPVPIAQLLSTGKSGAGYGYGPGYDANGSDYTGLGFRSDATYPPEDPGATIVNITNAPPLYTRSYQVHLTADTAGGPASSELRIIGPIPNPWRLQELVISPLAGVTVGQFLDVLVSTDDHVADVAPPNGVSIFDNIRRNTATPAIDRQRGLQVPVDSIRLTHLHTEPNRSRCLQLFLYFIAPAAALPDVNVSLIIAEVDPSQLAQASAAA